VRGKIALELLESLHGWRSAPVPVRLIQVQIHHADDPAWNKFVCRKWDIKLRECLNAHVEAERIAMYVTRR
jgi:hypothetical protein